MPEWLRHFLRAAHQARSLGFPGVVIGMGPAVFAVGDSGPAPQHIANDR